MAVRLSNLRSMQQSTSKLKRKEAEQLPYLFFKQTGLCLFI